TSCGGVQGREGLLQRRVQEQELRNGLAGACYARAHASKIASAGGQGGSGATSPSVACVLQLRVRADRRDRVEAAGERHRRRSVLSHLPRR
ncbi:hypothetical protein ACJX0J_019776, partial [Zea mays]